MFSTVKLAFCNLTLLSGILVKNDIWLTQKLHWSSAVSDWAYPDLLPADVDSGSISVVMSFPDKSGHFIELP